MNSNRRNFLITASAMTVAASPILSGSALAAEDLKTIDGDSAGLQSSLVSDKWNLVMIWSTNCGVCRKETPQLSDLYDEEIDGEITLLGISIDGLDATEEVQKFAADYDMRFPTLLGEFVTVASEYTLLSQEELRGTPTFMLFDPEGALAAVNPGPVRPQAVREFVAKRNAG